MDWPRNPAKVSPSRSVEVRSYGHSVPPHPHPCMGLSLSSTKLPHAPLSFRAFCDGGGNATLGVPAKRKRALLRSNLPRNSRPETNCDATGAGEQPLVGVCVDHLNFASSCWHH